MMQHNKILVAFDGSENGLKALDIAKKLTIDNDAKLTVAYVHESAFNYPINVGRSRAGDEFMFQQGKVSDSVPKNRTTEARHTVVVEDEIPKRVIKTAKSKLADIEDVTYEKLVGQPADEIVKYATNSRSDLIVIGNRGVSGFKKLFMGSVSKRVSNHSKCSVFIVK